MDVVDDIHLSQSQPMSQPTPQPQAEPQPPTRRLFIPKIELYNFKSYAGRQVIGPFHQNFSAVVGPNGSGKSNLIDALLFVFCKPASKIRLKKVSELIHDSTNHKNLTECSVTVFFEDIVDQPDGTYVVVPGSEFTVTRSAYPNSTSKYFVNGRPSKANQVADLLKTRGIDLVNNRFLILQGEVEQIAMMKPRGTSEHDEGLMEYLEEIIGSNQYVQPIKDAGDVVEKLNEKRQEKLNIVKFVEKEKDQLESAKQEALEVVRQGAKLMIANSTHHQLNRYEHDLANAKILEQRAQFEEKLAIEREKFKEQQQELNELRAQYEQAEESLKTVRAEFEKTKLEFKEFERKDAQVSEQLKFASAQSKKKTAEVEKMQKDLVKNREALVAQQRMLPQRERDVSEAAELLTESEAKLEAIYSTLKSETEKLRRRLEKKQKQLEPLAEQLAERESRRDIVSTELALLQTKVGVAEQQLRDAITRRTELKEILARRQLDITEFPAEISRAAASVKAAEHEIRALTAEEEDIDRSLRAQRAQLSEAQQNARQQRSHSTVLNQLMQAKAAGAISGIEGRLGDLGTIDDRFGVAASTAMGHNLDSVVVGTVDIAQRCIQFLRDNKLGTATFLCLDKIGHLQQQMLRPAAPNTTRLFDLVQTPNQYRVAFYWALKETLLAETLEEAQRLAYQRDHHNQQQGSIRRVVTLAGEIIEPSGTMSGGGTTRPRGGLQSQRVAIMSDAEMHELKTAIDRRHEQLQLVRQRKHELETEMHRNNDLLQNRSVGLDKAKVEIEALKSQSKLLDAQIPKLQKEADEAPADSAVDGRIALLRREKEQLESEVQSLNTAVVQLRSELDALQLQILNAGGERLAAAKTEVDEMKKQSDLANSIHAKARVAVSTLLRKIEKAEGDLEEGRKELDELRANLKAKKEEQKTMENAALAVMEAHRKGKEDVKKNEEAKDMLQEKFRRKTKEFKMIRSTEQDIKLQLEECTKLIAENQRQTALWTKKIADQNRKYQAHTQYLFEEEDEELQQQQQQEQQHQQRTGPQSQNDELSQPDKVEYGIDGVDVPEGGSENANPDSKLEAPPPARATRRGERDRDPLQQHPQGWLLPRTIPELSREELAVIDRKDLEYQITIMEESNKHLKANMQAIVEFRRKEQEYLAKVRELDEATAERDAQRKVYDALRARRLQEFLAGFHEISTKLKEMYQMLTLGGDAELDLVDYMDPFAEGISFSVRPPKKSWKNISNLSGGERTLSSLALVFALHHYKPTPLYVMDEIDAALDFKNVSIVANYIKERTKNAQFIIISLRNNMFELADHLVGIYKNQNATKSITINPTLVAMTATPPA